MMSGDKKKKYNADTETKSGETETETKFVTPVSKSRKSLGGKRKSTSGCFKAFKSPVMKKKLYDSESQDTDTSSVSYEDQKLKLAKDLVALEEKSKELENEIQELEKTYDENDINLYINSLHDYNEIKDAAQMILGRLAEWQRTTTLDLYDKFGLDLDD